MNTMLVVNWLNELTLSENVQRKHVGFSFLHWKQKTCLVESIYELKESTGAKFCYPVFLTWLQKARLASLRLLTIGFISSQVLKEIQSFVHYWQFFVNPHHCLWLVFGNFSQKDKFIASVTLKYFFDVPLNARVLYQDKLISFCSEKAYDYTFLQLLELISLMGQL